MLAVGYADAATVDLLDGYSLARCRAEVDGLRNGPLSNCHLVKRMAGPSTRRLYLDGVSRPVLLGPMRAEASAGFAGRSRYSHGLAALPDGPALGAAADRSWNYWSLTGDSLGARFAHGRLSKSHDVLAVSADAPCRFLASSSGAVAASLRTCARASSGGDPPADQQTVPAKQAGLAVEGWNDGFTRPWTATNRAKAVERSQKPGNPPGRGRFLSE